MDKKILKNLFLETLGQIPLLKSLMTLSLKLLPFSRKTNYTQNMQQSEHVI